MRGIDVSRNNESINWAAMKKAGIRFGIARCVTEALTIDPTFTTNISGMKANGIIPGAYIYLNSGKGSEQAVLLATAIPDPHGLIIALDVERNTDLTQPNATDISTFFTKIRTYTNWKKHIIFLYGSKGATLGTIGASTTLSHYGPLWLANYVSPTYPGNTSTVWKTAFSGWKHPTIWQYSSKGSIVGHTGNLDLDWFKSIPEAEQLPLFGT